MALAESYKQARKQNGAEKENNDDGFVARMLNSILSTLQLTITKLHVRFEDPGIPRSSTFSDFHCPSYAAGICISSLSGLSTDSQWNESTTSGSLAEILLYKLLSVKSNAIYLDTGDSSVLPSSSTTATGDVQATPEKASTAKAQDPNANRPLSGFNDAMERTMAQRCDGGAHSYLIEPTEATFRVTLNRNKGNFSYPQLQLESVFHAVSLGVRPLQVQSLLFMGKRLQYFNTSTKYLQWRPSETPSQNPRAWWKFVINSVRHEVRERHKPWLPESIDLRRKRREAYVPLFERTINAKAKVLSTAEKAELVELERVLAFDDIMYFRALAEIRVQKDDSARATAASQQQQAGWGSWISSFVWTPTTPGQQPPAGSTNNVTATGSVSTPAQTPTSTPTKATPSKTSTHGSNESFWESVQLSEEETSQLLDAINFERNDSGAPQSRLKPPPDYTKFQVNWNQSKGELRIFEDAGTPLASFAFLELSSHVSIKESQMALEVSVMAVEAVDYFTTRTHFPRIAYPQQSTSTSPLLQLMVVNNKRSHTPSAPHDAQSPSFSHEDHSRIKGAPAADWNVDFSLKKLNLVLNAALVKRGLECFQEPFKSDTNDVEDFSAAASAEAPPPAQGQNNSSWTSWNTTKRRNEQLLALATLKPSTNVRVKIEAPNILIPKDCTLFDSPIIVLELGTLTIASKMSEHHVEEVDAANVSHASNPASSSALSTPQKAKSGGLHITASSPHPNGSHHATSTGSADDQGRRDIDVSNFYDQYDFSISNIQAIVSRTERVGAIYGLSTAKNPKPLSRYSRIIHPLGFNISLAICKINVESLPNVKLSAALPSIRLILSSTKISTAKNLISSIVKQIIPPKPKISRSSFSGSDYTGSSPVRPNSAPPNRDFSPLSPMPLGPESLTKPNTPLLESGSSRAPSLGSIRQSTMSQLIGDLSYTQSLAAVASRPEEELVAIGLGISIELDIPEIEVTLVQGKTPSRNRESTLSHMASPMPASESIPIPTDSSPRSEDKSRPLTHSRRSSASSDSYASAVSSERDPTSTPSSPRASGSLYPISGDIDPTMSHQAPASTDEGHSNDGSRAGSSDAPFDLPRLDVPKIHTELVCLRLTNLGYRLESYPKSIQSRTFLKSLSVEDFSQSPSSPFRYLITSQILDEEDQATSQASSDLVQLDEVLSSVTVTDESLIQVTHTYRFPEHLALTEIHNYCKIRFNELQINFSIRTIRGLMRFLRHVSSNPDKSTFATVPLSPSRSRTPSHSASNSFVDSPQLLSVPTPDSTPKLHQSHKRKTKEDARAIQFLLDLECEAIVLNFVERNAQPLAEVSLRGSSGSFRKIADKGWIIQAKLGNAKVVDTYISERSANLHGEGHPSLAEPLATSKRNHIISVKGPHVIELTLTNIAKEETLSMGTPANLERPNFTYLDVQINSIRVLINPKWVFTMVLNVKELIDAFQPPRTDEPELGESDLLLISPVIDYLAAPGVFSYKVKMMRPFIIFPKDRLSTSVLITDWGEIDVSHSIEEQPLPPLPGQALASRRRFREKITVSLKKANMATGQFARSAAHFSPFSKFENRRPIMDECDILVTIASSYLAHANEPRFDKLTEVHIAKLHLFLSPEQVTFLFNVTQNSLFYTPTESEIRRRLQAALADEAKELEKEEAARLSSPPTGDSDVPSVVQTVVPSETGRMRIQLDVLVVEADDHYELFPAHGTRPIASPPKLLLLEVSKSKIAWSTLDDGSLRLGFQIGSLNMSDLRPVSMRTNRASYGSAAGSVPASPRKEPPSAIPVIVGFDSGKSQLVGSFVTVPAKGHFTVSLTYNHLQFLPEASILQKTWQNLGPLLLVDLIGLLAHRERIMVSSLTPRQEKKWRAEKFHPEAGSVYSFTLVRPQIVLVRDESSSATGSWLKFNNVTASTCEVNMRFMPAHQSYSLALHELSTSVGETFNASLPDLFRPGSVHSPANSHSTHPHLGLDNTLYHYNILSPCSLKLHLILLPTAQDYQIECLDIAKLSFSYNDYKNLLAMFAPFGVNHLKPKDLLGSASSDAPSASSSTKAHRVKMQIKEKPTVPTISDDADYRMIRTDASIGATAVNVAVSKDPKRATEYWASLDEEKKKGEKDVPSLTLGTAAPTSLSASLSTTLSRPSTTATSTPSPSDIDALVALDSENDALLVSLDASETEPAEEVPMPPEFVHKKLLVFSPKIQIMLMDNREYDLGVVRAEVSAEECWLQDWGASAYIAQLSAAQLDLMKAASLEKDQDLLPHLKAALRATFSADSFNTKVAAWETFVDPIDIDFGLTDRSVVLKSDNPLNLTVSETFLSSYKRFRNVVESSNQAPEFQGPDANSLNSLKASQESPSPRVQLPARHRIQAPYYVKNETGLPIKYRLFPEDLALSPTEERTLSTGIEEPIAIPLAWTTHFRNQEEAIVNSSSASSKKSPLNAKTSEKESVFRHLDRSAQSIAGHHFALSAHVSTFLAATDLSVDQLGTQVAHIGQGRLLIIEIQYRLGAKLITFKSRFSIHNNTSFPLIVGKEYVPKLYAAAPATKTVTEGQQASIQHATLPEPSDLQGAVTAASKPAPAAVATASGNKAFIKKIATIEPYSMWSIPLDCIADTVLRFRPSESRSAESGNTSQTNQSDPSGSQFGWSQMRCEVRNLKPSAPIFVDCTSAPPSQAHPSSGKLAPDVSSIFQWTVGVSRLANKSAILAGAEQLVVHFQPPLVIENLLPATMTFSIEPTAQKRLNTQNTYLPKVGKLKKGQRLPVHQVPSQCYITLRMSVRDFQWSPHILLRKPEALGASALRDPSDTSGLPLNSDLPLSDAHGVKLRVKVENQVNELGTRTVTFYTDFWIVNKTGLPLLARAHISNPAAMGAGMASLYGSSANASESDSRDTGYDVLDDRNASGVYGGDLRDFFMPDLSAGCFSAGISAPTPPSTSSTIGTGDDTSTLSSSSAAPTTPPPPATTSHSPKVPNTAKPIMYSPYGFENKRFHLKVAESRWSESLVLNTQNDSTVFSIYEKEDATRVKRKFELALTIRPAANQFWRTRVVTVAPRYIMINKTPYTIFVRQVNSSVVSTLLPGEHVPFHWLDASRGLDTFRIKWNLPKCTWSGPIDPSQLEMFTLKLFNAETGLRYLLRANVRLHPDSSISTITFKEEDLNAPLFRIDNYTNATVLVRQLNLDYATEAIPPLSRRIWGWLQPAYGSHRVQVLFNTVDKVGLSFSLAKVKAYPPIQFQTRQGKVWVLAETSTERTTRVLSLRPIADPAIERIRLHSKKSGTMSPGLSSGHARVPSSPLPTSSSIPGASAPTSPTSANRQSVSNADDEALEESLRLQVSFSKVSVSLINAEPLELIYGTLSRIDATYVNYGVRWSVDLSIGDIQIDNQIPTTFYPVAVFSLGDAPAQWLRFSMIRSYEYADIIYQPFVSVLLRATTIRLDELLVLKLLDLTGVTLASFSNTNTALLTSNVDVMTLGEHEDASKMIYNHLYLLNPVALNVSFLSSASAARARHTQIQQYDQDYFTSSAATMGGPLGPGNRADQRQQTNVILGIPDKFIPNVESAPINLNALLLKHSFVSSDQLRNRIMQHYKTQLVRQMYAVLGSFEALGNPISLVSNLGTGVKDLFYEPAKGIAISPEEFGAGLKRGGASFVSKSVAGLFDSTSKVLRTLGSGIAIMSLDDDYQARRDLSKRRDQPTNALAGMMTGFMEFGENLAEGVAGLIVQPIKGFQQEGAVGIAKGVGRGLIGVAVKPVVGTLDLVSRATEGISSSASQTVLRRRLRYPRYIPEDGLLGVFDNKHSTAMHVLHSIENSAFAHEEYWGYIMVSRNREEKVLLGWVLIASSRRIFLVSRNYPASTATTSSSSHPPQGLLAPPEVNVEWIAPYATIIEVGKLQIHGKLKIKVATRTRDGVSITHQISAADVKQCVEIEGFIGGNLKKWTTLSQFAAPKQQ